MRSPNMHTQCGRPGKEGRAVPPTHGVERDDVVALHCGEEVRHAVREVGVADLKKRGERVSPFQ